MDLSLERLERFALLRDIAYFLPFSPDRGVIWFFLNKKSRSILDVGCGIGRVMRAINLHNKSFFRVGVDIFLPYIKSCHREKIYDACVLADIRHLPFKKKTFDAVLCIQVIEHLPKIDA